MVILLLTNLAQIARNAALTSGNALTTVFATYHRRTTLDGTPVQLRDGEMGPGAQLCAQHIRLAVMRRQFNALMVLGVATTIVQS